MEKALHVPNDPAPVVRRALRAVAAQCVLCAVPHLMRTSARQFIFIVMLVLLLSPFIRADAVIRPKVVVIALFELGADTGDAPGEYQYWVEREKLDRVIPLAAAFHDVRTNADGSVIAIVGGMGNTNATASIMALGLDPRFDLTKSYWLVAGIGGVDPRDASVGCAVWADYVIEGDLAYEIDAREIPKDWETGLFPLGKKRPFEQPVVEYTPGQHFQLDAGLVQWAFNLTRDTPLADSEPLQKLRGAYTGFPNAQRPPFVMIGANVASSTYWHGVRLSAWANQWTRYYSQGEGNYVTTAMEDTGVLRALQNLTRAGKADNRRALVLRTASNFDQQPPGGSAADSLAGEKVGGYSAYIPSLEAAHRVGSRVVHALVEGWSTYESTPPSAAP